MRCATDDKEIYLCRTVYLMSTFYIHKCYGGMVHIIYSELSFTQYHHIIIRVFVVMMCVDCFAYILTRHSYL